MKITEERLRQIIEEELQDPSYEYTVAGYKFNSLEEAKQEALELKRPVLDKANNVVVEWNTIEEGEAGIESVNPTTMRDIRDQDKRAFHNLTPQDTQAVAAAMPGYNMVDHTSRGRVQTAAQMADPKDVLLLGVTPQHIYFKTMDDKVYRMPRTPMGETVGVAGVQHDPDLNIQEAGFGEGTPPEGELYKKQVIALEEGPLEVADQVNQAMRGLLDLLQSRDAKQLNDPEIRDLEAMLKKKEKELNIGGQAAPQISATPGAYQPVVESELRELVEEVIEEMYGSGRGGKIGFKHVRAPRPIGGPSQSPPMQQTRPQHTEEDFVIAPIKMVSGKYPGQLYVVTHKTQPHNPLKFYRSEQEAIKDLPGVVQMANQFPRLLNL